ncbi:hypothetical protein BBJ28_00011930 [Nothophytophthora sp. Chile5]|nr:hypothetical protein BBJ28_00011930 [Nothophytophthora sp. Chile5]
MSLSRSRVGLAVGLALLILISQQSVEAHSWIDCFDTDYTKIYTDSASYIYGGSGGNGFCEGYGAGYPGRGDTDIGTEYTYKMLQNEVEAGTAVCETVDADTYTNTDWRTRLSVAAGETVYFAYLPNGHIVKDKKAIGTQHGIYWTGEVGTSLTSTLEMTADNLLDGYTLDFDDGNCGESVDSEGNPGGRAGDGKPCIGSFVIPTGTAEGIYSFVWYWTFWLDDASSYVDQSQASGYFGAAYSTCFEVEVTSSSGSSTSETDTTTTDTPEATTTAPEATTAAPEATTAAPEATTAAPEATTVTPVDEVDSNTAAGDADLAVTAAPETPTTTTPEVTTATPEATTVTPVDEVDSNTAAGDADLSVTDAPTSTPEVTTATPTVTTAVPVETTTAPAVTTAAPAVTTAAPEATTTAPVAVTEAPAATTAAPIATTETPAVTTATPEASTAAPEASTTAPGATTVTPEPSDNGYPSNDSTTFSTLDDDNAEDTVGTVHAADTSSASSENETSATVTIESSTISGGSEVNVGSGSTASEIEVVDSSAASSEASSPSSTATSASSAVGSASALTEDSAASSTASGRSWLLLVCALVVGAVW